MSVQFDYESVELIMDGIGYRIFGLFAHPLDRAHLDFGDVEEPFLWHSHFDAVK